MLLKSILGKNNLIQKPISRSFAIFRAKQEPYKEMYNISKGITENGLGGYARLTRNFPMRRIRDKKTTTQMGEDDASQTYNHLTVPQRIKIFMWGKKKRFFLTFLVILAFQFSGNALCFVLATAERALKKFRKNFVLSYFPECYALKSAHETTFEPKSLSRRSTTALCDKFIEVDRKLPNGFTREMLFKALNVIGENDTLNIS